VVAARTGPVAAKVSKGISRRSIKNSGVKSSGMHIYQQRIYRRDPMRDYRINVHQVR
jgi:hypothetical protein